MMNHTGSVSLGLGLLFAVPALTFGDGLPDSVRVALGETVRALEVLGQLESGIASGDGLPSSAAAKITEAPIGDERSREERRSELRDEVADLQTKVDAKNLTSGLPTASIISGPSTIGSLTDDDGSFPIGKITPGLSPTFIRALGGAQFGPSASAASALAHKSPAGLKPSSSTPTTSGPSMTGPTSEPSLVAMGGDEQADPTTSVDASDPSNPSPEGNGYSAHPLRQAQACYRAGRFEKGIELLAVVDPNPEVNYWKARLYEKVGRTKEAIRMYNKVELDEAAGDLREAAKREREFAEWREAFETKSGIKAKSASVRKGGSK